MKIPLAKALGAPLAATILAAALPAYADAIPPDVAACDGKKAGDVCTTAAQRSGTCTLQKCATARPDAAPATYDCLSCGLGAGDAGAGSDGGAGSFGGGGCSVADAGRTAGTLAFALAPLGVLALGRARRRARR